METETHLIEYGEKWNNGFRGIYKQHSIAIERDCPLVDWYIVVIDSKGRVTYDGWWKNSAEKSVDEAITQALKESFL